ncbi:MAG: hypothetical protein ACR2HH_12560 [Chthoniobacterales bacterium]
MRISQRLSLALAFAAFFSAIAPVPAVILFRTGDPAANTTEPTGALANSGWQFEGKFGNFLGTAIAPHFFITAHHIGGTPVFTFRGVNYTVVRTFDDPASDLRICQVAETLPAFAPLFTSSDEVGRRLVVVGRGTRRGPDRIVNGALRGWEWGASDMIQRWGENQVGAITSRDSLGDFLQVFFDQAGLPNEAHLSGGDSGGGLFVDDNGVWKLAGISYDVDSFASGPDAGGPYNAAMFDERGSYTANGSLVSGNAPVPSAFYASRISPRVAWITSIISPRLANISARVSVRDGDAVSIGGFIIQGDNGQTKRILVRALGPSLQVAGAPLPGRLADPVLELYNAGGQVISANDNWQDAQPTEIRDTGLAPADAREAALVQTLPVGNYTAILRGANATSGTGLVEVYDLEPDAAGARLANLSARAFVGTGDDVLIGGLIVRSVSQRLLLRALGPTLSARGVPNSLGNPTLELHNADGALVSANDDWMTASNQSEISNTGLAPTNARESAILVDSSQSAYTAVVRGINNTTGIALLEAYLLE